MIFLGRVTGEIKMLHICSSVGVWYNTAKHAVTIEYKIKLCSYDWEFVCGVTEGIYGGNANLVIC